MDSYQVTDEGDGLVRVDAQIRLVRKPIAVAMCDEVDRVVAGYDGFRILMNMSAMSKGTPAAGFFVLRTMKKYPLQKLALFGANGFMRGMAKVVLGLARFDSFELFDDEARARAWLDQPGSEPAAGPAATGAASAPGGVRRLAVPAGLLASGAVLFRLSRRRRRRATAQPASAG
ncbi:MAG TPA: STAS/SEC14 domain-containing protein [Acidimicrobiia bacterium]|nr:STAS/SEC14 domain-containing protein [Acidimicrobiia bacterium]